MHRQIRNFFIVATLGLFFVVNWVFTAIRNLKWWWNGTSAEVQRRHNNWQLTPQHAHRMKILVPYNLHVDPVLPMHEYNFMLTHDGFVEPEYVLRDDVSLLHITKECALFIQQDPTMSPPFASKYNFTSFGQVATGRYIIKIPIQSFLKLGEEMECEEEKIILLHNIGRCGGTLLNSCFEHTGRAVAWCEPRALDNTLRFGNYAWDRKTSRRLLRCTLKMLAKPYHGFHDSTLAYAIKVSALVNGDNEAICNAVPKAKHVFMYRDLNVAAHSGQRVFWMVPSHFFLYMSYLLNNPQAMMLVYHYLGTRSKGMGDISYRYDPLLEYIYRLQIISFAGFNRMRESGLKVTALRYEDLMREPDRVLTELMKALNMPESLASEAKKALKADSQATQPFNQKDMAKFREFIGERDPNEELLRDELQEISEEYGVPGPRDWEKELIKLPGTI